MNIVIIGSGGREHALCYKLLKSSKINKIYCIPGNAGTDEIATNIFADINDFDEIYKIVLKLNVELIVVGPEIPLVNGIVDYFEKKNIKIFGPNKKCSQLEGSKFFMKNICKKYNIPSAKYFEISDINQIEKFLSGVSFPVVVKSDGLAAGKGVTICNNLDEVIKDVQEILDGKFKSSNKVFIEEFLEGEELSYFVITDGYDYKCLGTAQDHKKIGEGDVGLNTGGMGAYSPSKIINNKLENKIQEEIIKPTLNGLRKEGLIYKGILYAGLMINNGEPKLIEYNIRFGDPECQVLMMRLNSDLLEILISTLENKILEQKITWSENDSITVVAANKGYPEQYKKNSIIKNLDTIKVDDNQQIFHAGTTRDKDGKILATGGRVLNSTVLSKSLSVARKKANEILENVKWENKYYRKDIGFRVIDK